MGSASSLDDSNVPRPDLEAPAGRTLRYFLAGTLAVLVLTLTLLSTHIQALQNCSRHFSRLNASTTCTPLTASSAPVLIGVLLVALLLLPDFAEIAVPGLISLRRRIEGQERRQRQLEEKLSFVLSNSASAQINQNFSPIVADLSTFRRLILGVDEKVGTEESAPGSDEPMADENADERDRLCVELLQRWERLAAAEKEALKYDFGAVSSSLDISNLELSISDAINELATWRDNFSVELEYVHAARNAVAHARPIETETIEQAVELAARLEDALPFKFSSKSDQGHQDAYRDFERRAIDWIESQGVVKVSDPPLGLQRYDFVGMQGGRLVIVESRLGTRWLTGNTLRRWAVGLMRSADLLPDARRVLCLRIPGVNKSGWNAVRDLPVEMYIEKEFGVFEPLEFRK